MKAIALFIKGATSQAISSLKHDGAEPSLLKISCRRYASKSTSDDHNIV
jgi:TPP-dependent pyruvate/acetoin dehydrogenase alpha subunit